MEGDVDVTGLLEAHAQGEPEALDRLVAAVYQHLHRLARKQLRAPGRRSQTLDTTGLVHEAYLRLAGPTGNAWRDRGHFFAAASQAMRHVLVDFARGRLREKRGGGQRPVTLEPEMAAVAEDAAQLLALDQALHRLDASRSRLVRVVECRYFAGLSEEETAEALEVSVRTVQRDWRQARTWLRRELSA